MARGINKVILVGNVGGDPDVKYMPSGSAITNISIATSESWKDKQTGQQQERTEWHRVVFFNRLAEIAGEYLKKGQQVYVEGSLRTRKWQDNNGNDRYSTEIVANEMQMLGGRSNNNMGGGYDNMNNNYNPAPQQNKPAPQQSNNQNFGGNAPAPQQNFAGSAPAPQQNNARNFEDFDDDIPF